ncbi:MAG TPA: CNNM domain-containing protein [Victivallales bacterium]|nr:CNNM domain-containing protein [Victivallales bacterium]
MIFTSTTVYGDGDISSISVEELNLEISILGIYMLIALGFSFICSISESTLLCITPSYVEGQKIKRPKYASMLRKLRFDEVDRSLAAILTLNTIANTIGAIIAGNKAAEVFGSAWIGVFSGIMTILILFFSEIAPKTIGAIYWKKLAWFVAVYVRILIFLLYPVVWISEKFTKFISQGKKAHSFNRDEIVAMTRIGKQSGHVNEIEYTILGNLFKLDLMRARDIMKHRTAVYAFPEDITIAEAAEKVDEKSFSRIPIYSGGIDQITGFVLKTEVLLKNINQKGSEKLSSIKREILMVPDTISLIDIMKELLDEGQHIFVALDEHGGTSGIVTMEDILEVLADMDILDEKDSVK